MREFGGEKHVKKQGLKRCIRQSRNCALGLHAKGSALGMSLLLMFSERLFSLPLRELEYDGNTSSLLKAQSLVHSMLTFLDLSEPFSEGKIYFSSVEYEGRRLRLSNILRTSRFVVLTRKRLDTEHRNVGYFGREAV